MVAIMTNEQLAILLRDIQTSLDCGIAHAEHIIKKDCPELKNVLGNLKTTAFFSLKALNDELRQKINSLTPTKFP